MFKRVPGTKDILPEEVCRWQEIEAQARAIFALYGYAEIRPPMIEEASLFDRSLGSSTEIVQKQMFLIKNKEDTYALRPEGTAPIVRSFIENNLEKTGNLAKLFYLGPMFRLERPQKGRLRQFHHIGCEVIGSADPAVDVEVIALARHLLDACGVTGYALKLNTLGCADDKLRLAETLRSALAAQKNDLCEDCRNRFDTNVLRILDCKQEGCRKITGSLQLHESCVCEQCAAHFASVRQGLDSLGLQYEVAVHLVRGLDYYTRTVFEFTHADLGAQDAVGAGGRYDNLVKELGGPPLGAAGFAFGVERMLIASPQMTSNVAGISVFVISLGERARAGSLPLIAELRRAGISCDTDYEGRSLKGAMRQANDLNARFALIIGDNEIEKGVVTLKEMRSGEQREVERTKVIESIRNG